MCLITTSLEPSIAEEDIVCFKVLWHHVGHDDYKTAFKDIAVSDDILNGKKCFVAEGETSVKPALHCDTYRYSYSVSSGYIHTYKDLEFAKTQALSWTRGDVEHCVYKCVIPKGTKFYIGRDGDLCSKKIKFISRV